jgi:transcription-repair coupling factor (superfamily II helicase)
LVPKSLKLNEPSFQRLKTMEQNTALGSGYKIALKDLDIRGPGNLFGEKQSGAVSGVGFHLYNKILKEAIDEARGKVKRESPTNIIFHYSCGFPESYVPLLEDRLYFYQSLALSNTKESVCDIESELKDRYGSLPDEAFFLVSAAKLRVFLSGTSIAKLSLQNDFVELFFKSIEPFLSVEKLLLGIEKSFNLNKNTVVLKNVSGGLLSAKITELSVARASFGLFESSLSRLFLS